MAFDPDAYLSKGGFNPDEYLSTKPVQAQPKGYIERVSERRKERTSELADTFQDYNKGEISQAELGLQMMGKGVGGMVMDVGGEALVSVGRGLSYIIPDSIEEPVKQSISEGLEYLMDTDAGNYAKEAVIGGIETWNEYKAENPRAAKNIESVVNIGLLVAPAKVRANAKPTVLAKTSNKIGGMAGKQIAKKRAETIKDLVLPIKTRKVLESEVARTTEKGIGPFKRSVVAPTVRESEIIREVSKIKGVSANKSAQQNYMAIKEANKKLANKLEVNVAKNRTPIPLTESSQAIDDAIKVVIDENPIIVGNLKTTAKRVSEKAKKILSENDPTPSGLLKSRKEFDNWVRALPRGEAKLAVDASMESQSIAIKTVRNSMNDLLDSKVKSAAVKKGLKSQSLLYNALDNITPKAALSANTAIGRAWQNAFKVLGIRNKAIQSAAAVMGVGGLGAAAQFAPVFTAAVATAGAAGLAGKLVLSAKSKVFAGKLINIIDKALLTSKNPSMIKQLRADRALIVELLENSEPEQNTGLTGEQN